MPHARKDILTWQPEGYYHIYNRGARQGSIFRESTNYFFVIERMKQYARSLAIRVIAYCLMPNHYHFLLRQEGETPAGLLPQRVFNSYTKAYNKRYEQSGTLFEHRFQAKAIKNSGHLLHLCRYIHANPVKDGLVADPADWPYSNYLDWIGEREDALLDRTFIREQFTDAAEYKTFVLDYLRNRILPEDVQRYLNGLS
ncbi:MAG: transposase [Chloroflexota bacterium]